MHVFRNVLTSQVVWHDLWVSIPILSRVIKKKLLMTTIVTCLPWPPARGHRWRHNWPEDFGIWFWSVLLVKYNVVIRVPLRMGGECRMVGVAGATPTLPLPYQFFVRLSLMATPNAHQKHAKPCSRHTNFGHNAPPNTHATTCHRSRDICEKRFFTINISAIFEIFLL